MVCESIERYLFGSQVVDFISEKFFLKFFARSEFTLSPPQLPDPGPPPIHLKFRHRQTRAMNLVQ